MMSLQSIQARAGASVAALAAALMFVPATPAAANPTPRPDEQVTCQPDSGGVRDSAPGTAAESGNKGDAGRAQAGNQGAGGQTDADRADPVPDPGTAYDDTAPSEPRDEQSEEAPAEESSQQVQPSGDQTANSKATSAKNSDGAATKGKTTTNGSSSSESASGQSASRKASVSDGGVQAQLRKILQELYDLLQSMTGQD